MSGDLYAKDSIGQDGRGKGIIKTHSYPFDKAKTSILEALRRPEAASSA